MKRMTTLTRRKGMNEKEYFKQIERLHNVHTSRGDHIDKYVIWRHEHYLTKWDRIYKTLALSFIVFFGYVFNPNIVNESHLVKIEKPYVIKIEVAEVYNKAEIKLPPGLQFYSHSFPEISLVASLNFDLDRVNKRELAFVVMGQEKGTHSIALKLSGKRSSAFQYVQVKVGK